MEDTKIVELFWNRDEDAINKCSDKYGKWLRTIAYNILLNREDSEECENDTYVRAWNAIPPGRPQVLKAYLGRIVRNLSINRIEERSAKKRGGDNLLLSELSECIPSGVSVEAQIELKELTDIISAWLMELPKNERIIFVRRYWFGDGVKEIAVDLGGSPNKLSGILFRLRKGLKNRLEKEGQII